MKRKTLIRVPLEKESEQRLLKEIKKRGGECYKFNSEQNRGVSDRLVILHGCIYFVEMKREGIVKLSPRQARFKKRVTELGCTFILVSGHKGVDAFCRWLDYHEARHETLSKLDKQLKPEILEMFD